MLPRLSICILLTWFMIGIAYYTEYNIY